MFTGPHRVQPLWRIAAGIRTCACPAVRRANRVLRRALRHGAQLVLVNSADQADVRGVLIRSERTVQPNNFWVGMHDDTWRFAA